MNLWFIGINVFKIKNYRYRDKFNNRAIKNLDIGIWDSKNQLFV